MCFVYVLNEGLFIEHQTQTLTQLVIEGLNDHNFSFKYIRLVPLVVPAL